MQVPPARLRGLVRRYRVDRRLPPPVRALFLDTLRLRQADRVACRKAEVLPVLGADAVFGSPSVGRWRDRRLVTSGAVSRRRTTRRSGPRTRYATSSTPPGYDRS